MDTDADTDQRRYDICAPYFIIFTFHAHACSHIKLYIECDCNYMKGARMSYLLWTRTRTRICHVYIVRRMCISHMAWVDHVVGRRSQTEIQGVASCGMYCVQCKVCNVFVFVCSVMYSGVVFATMCFHNSIIQSQSELQSL